MSARRATSMTAAERWNMAASTTSRRPAAQSRRTLALQTPKSAFAAGNRLGNVDIRAALPDGNVQASVAVKALLKGLIVARELKLMLPFELN